jgi:hypothetical protein
MHTGNVTIGGAKKMSVMTDLVDGGFADSGSRVILRGWRKIHAIVNGIDDRAGRIFSEAL